MARTLNVESALSSQGLQLKGVNPDGTVQVVDLNDPEQSERKLNLPKALEAEGINLQETNLKYNSPNTAFEENGLGFAAGVKLALAKDKKNRTEILKQEFGEDNVTENDLGETVVKDESTNAWRRADAGFLETLTAESGVAAGGIAGFAAGAKAGAAVGTAVLPGIGTGAGGLLGGLFGGAVGATVGRLGTNEIAEELNIRTESDAQEIKTELAKEFTNALIWDTALLGAGKVLKPVGKAASSFVKRGFDKFSKKPVMAEMMETLLPGTKKSDWSTVLRSTDDANAVLKDMDNVIKWREKAASGKVAKGAVDPSMDKSVRMVTGFLKSAKAQSKKDFGRTMDFLESQRAFSKGRLTVTDTRDTLENALREANVLDATGNFLTTNKALKEGLDTNLFSPSSRKQLFNMFKQIDNVVQNKKVIDVKQARKLMDGVDDILENSGVWKNGDLAINSQARATLKTVRNDIRNKMSRALERVDVRNPNNPRQMVKASVVYNDANLRYHKFRNVFDDFAVPSQFGSGERRRTFQTVSKMLGENGADLERNFGELAKLTGRNGEKILNRLQQLRAGRNLSSTYAPSRTGTIEVFKEQLLGITSPKVATRLVANQSARLDRMSQAAQSPVGKATLGSIKAMGELSNFVKNMPPVQKLELMSNPELFRNLIQPVLGVEDSIQTQSQELTP